MRKGLIVAEPILADADRCLLAVRGPRGPLLAPMACWWDGSGLWMTTAAVSAKIRALRRDPRCAVWVGLPGGSSGVAARGHARVFGLADPLRLVLHGPPISGALLVLAVRNLDKILGYLQDVPRVPARFMPRNRVIIRIHVEDARELPVPEATGGVAPPLPPQVPAGVRRQLAGQRRVVVATDDGAEVMVAPAVWGAGFALDYPDGHGLAGAAPASVVLDVEQGRRPTTVAGLAVHGELARDATRLAIERVTWWQGFDIETAEVIDTRDSVVLPD